MNRDRLVAALREQAEWAMLNDRSVPITLAKNLGFAADLIENQQRHIEALMKANDSLKDAIARRDKQIETLKNQVEVMAREQDAMGRRIAMMEEGKWAKT